MRVLLETTRQGYDTEQCGHTLTVGELIGMLEDYDENASVYFSNDNGYTYGSLNWDTIRGAASEEEE